MDEKAKARSDRDQIIQAAIFAALGHHKPDYRSPRLLDKAATVIQRFVSAALDEVDA
jgi:hypothetical protein